MKKFKDLRENLEEKMTTMSRAAKGHEKYGKEGVMEMDKSQTPPGRDGSNDPDAGKKEYTAKTITPKKAAKDGEKILNKIFNKKKGVAEEYELAGVGVAYELGRRAYREGKDLDKVRDKYNKYDESVMDTVKSVAKKVGKALTGGSDQDQLKNLQKKMGVPQTGKKPTSK